MTSFKSRSSHERTVFCLIYHDHQVKSSNKLGKVCEFIIDLSSKNLIHIGLFYLMKIFTLISQKRKKEA